MTALGALLTSKLVDALSSIAANSSAVVSDSEDKEVRTANRHFRQE